MGVSFSHPNLVPQLVAWDSSHNLKLKISKLKIYLSKQILGSLGSVQFTPSSRELSMILFQSHVFLYADRITSPVSTQMRMNIEQLQADTAVKMAVLSPTLYYSPSYFSVPACIMSIFS